jgi:hypothetical protein
MNLPLQMGAVFKGPQLRSKRHFESWGGQIVPARPYNNSCDSTQHCCTCAANNTDWACCQKGELCTCNGNLPACGTA